MQAVNNMQDRTEILETFSLVFPKSRINENSGNTLVVFLQFFGVKTIQWDIASAQSLSVPSWIRGVMSTTEKVYNFNQNLRTRKTEMRSALPRIAESWAPAFDVG